MTNFKTSKTDLLNNFDDGFEPFHSNDNNKDSALTQEKYRVVKALDLFNLNERSFHVFGYNRSVPTEALMYWMRSQAKNRKISFSIETPFVLLPVFYHTFKCGVPCEPHIRVMPILSTAVPEVDIWLLDIAMEDYLVLKTIDPTVKFTRYNGFLVPNVENAWSRFNTLRFQEFHQLKYKVLSDFACTDNTNGA